MKIHVKNVYNNKFEIFILLFIILFSLFWIKLPSYYDGMKNLRSNHEVQEDSLIEIKFSNTAMISGNLSDLIAAGLSTGTGTFSDPYLIRDLILVGNGSGNGIEIGANKNDYIRIENCRISNFSIGIYLFNSNNVTLYQNNCSQNAFGIYMDGFLTAHPSPEIFKYIGCMNDTIVENILNDNTNTGIYLNQRGDFNKFIRNEVNNNQEGIYIEGNPSHKNMFLENVINNNDVGLHLYGGYGNISVISGNELHQNKDYGIILGSVGFNLTNNIMSGSGISITETSIEGMSLNYIDTSNIVNNGPFYYYINKSNLTPDDFLNAGQIALVNCSNSFIKDGNFSYSSKGLSISHTNNVKILNCDSSNNYIGITLYNSNNSIIEGCTFDTNVYGLYSRFGSKNNTITQSSISNNLWYGIRLDFYCDNHFILDSELINNFIALNLRMSSLNVITGNVIKDNYYGIDIMGGSNYNLFYENFLRGNDIHTNGGSETNKWNSSQVGNYWDNYTGIDMNGDGIGDTPHNISLSPLIQDFLPIVDNNPPEIIILSPSNNSLFGNLAPSFSVLVKDKFLYKMWYVFNNNIHKYFFTENSSIDQEEWSKILQDQITLRFYVSDKTGNISSTAISIYKDTTDPIITINDPDPYDKYLWTIPLYNITITDLHLSSAWYALNNETAIPLTLNSGTLDETAWNALPYGEVNITFYAVDDVGNLGSSSVIIIKLDPTPASIIINSPNNNQGFRDTAPKFDLIVIGFDTLWYTLDGGITNITCGISGQIDPTIWDGLYDGQYTLRFYANTSTSIISHEEISIYKDTTMPVINIIEPNMGDEYIANIPGYEISVSDLHIDSVWYTIDNGITNISITNFIGILDEAAWNALPYGEVNITFYAVDDVGNLGSSSVIIYKNKPIPLPDIPGFYPFFIIVIILAGIIGLTSKQKHKLN